jgi:quercetin dioxygenase-like cupin family protein
MIGADNIDGTSPRIPGFVLPVTTSVRGLGNVASTLMEGITTGERLALIHSVERRGNEPPRHRHRNEDEFVYVLEGDLTFYLEGTVCRASAGDCVFLPRGSEHCYRVGSENACLLTAYIPAGIEHYVTETRDLNEAANVDIERLVTIAARYGVEITGPPPEAE